MEFVKKILAQMRDFFRNLSTGRKVALAVTGITVAASFVALFMWAGDTAYQTLGTNFTTEDATSIMRFLREKKIPFRVENDGRTIKIPPEVIYDLRLELATMGLPQAGVVGYEVFDKQAFGTTSFVQKINQKRALEGELMRTINNIKGVKRSRVHLALPNKSTFVEDQKRATASVALDLDAGMQLSDKQITGISHLIASAIEGMELGDVTIVDGNGKLLSKNTSDPLALQTATMLDFQQKQEGEMEKRIQDILTRVVGEGKVVAKVAMELDFTQQTETATQYDSEGAAVKSQQKESSVADGSRPVPMGPPGAVANTPGPAPASVTPEVRSNTQKGFEVTNYAVPERVTRTTKQLGSPKRMSVAILVDGVYAKDPAKPDGPAVYQKWPDDKLAEFRAIASSAVGLNTARGDSIEVRNMEFRREDLENADAQIAAFERRKMLMHVVQYAVLGLAIALFFFFIVRPFVKWLTDNTVENMESFLPKTIEELEKVQTVEKEDLAPLEEAIPVIVDKVDPEKVEGEMIKEKVVTLVEGNPMKAAMILHDWVYQPSKAGALAEKEAGAAGKGGGGGKGGGAGGGAKKTA